MARMLVSCELTDSRLRKSQAADEVRVLAVADLKCEERQLEVECLGGKCSSGHCAMRCEARGCGAKRSYDCNVRLSPSLNDRASCR